MSLLLAWLLRWSGHFWLRLDGEPRLRNPAAQIDFEYQMPQLAPGLEAHTKVDTLRAWALEQTSPQLYFRLGHRLRLEFPTQPRPANCIEYAHLFGTLFNQASRYNHMQVRAKVVHSPKARVLGLRLPFRGWQEHDWVMIDGPHSRPIFVDPTFHDYGLGWSLHAAVAPKEVLGTAGRN